MYAEEKNGLANLPAWQCITEAEYNKIKTPQTKILPSMAISTIKFDKEGLPKHVKYCIVALGNLDPNTLTKIAANESIMLLLELQFLASLSVKNKPVLKNGDVKQAFFRPCCWTTNNTFFALLWVAHALLQTRTGSSSKHFTV